MAIKGILINSYNLLQCIHTLNYHAILITNCSACRTSSDTEPYCSLTQYLYILTCNILLMWIVVSSSLLCSRGRERSREVSDVFPCSTVASAITESVSRSVADRFNFCRDLFTCNIDARLIPPRCPILQPSRMRVVIELLNCGACGDSIGQPLILMRYTYTNL